MILEHVWDYAFDPKTNVVDVLVCRLRNKIEREFRSEAHPYAARFRLCPQAGLKRKRRTFGFRMHVWFALVLIGLTAALFAAAYWFLFRAVQERDREVVRAQFDVYRAWYQEGGLPALMRQFSERRYSGRELFFVRVVGPQRTGLFVSFPPRFEDFDLGRTRTDEPKRSARLADGAVAQSQRLVAGGDRTASGRRLAASRARPWTPKARCSHSFATSRFG